MNELGYFVRYTKQSLVLPHKKNPGSLEVQAVCPTALVDDFNMI
jgi:hypothetical protein